MENKMKILVFILLIMCAPFTVAAGTWCEWDGTKGINCERAIEPSVVIGDHRVTVSAENLNPRGWFELITIKPDVGSGQTRGAEVWELVDNQINKTWTVRDLTTNEIDNHAASAMEVGQYYLWKALLAKGVITQAEAVSALPQEVIDAYLARQRLEQ